MGESPQIDQVLVTDKDLLTAMLIHSFRGEKNPDAKKLSMGPVSLSVNQIIEQVEARTQLGLQLLQDFSNQVGEYTTKEFY